MKFKDNVAFISGGLGDLGKSIAIKFAEQGAHISVADIRDPKDAAELENKIKSLGRKFLYVKADLAQAKNVTSWYEETKKQIGTPDLIIYSSAIINVVTSFMEVTDAQWDNEVAVNLSTAFYMSKISSQKLLEEKKPGRIVLIGSWAGHAVHSHIPSYCVSKAGLRMFVQCIAKELAPFNILVNEIAPGYVDAGLTGQLFQRNPSARETSRMKVPNRLLISSDDVADNVLFLCDPNNKHMVGSTLLMDGGLSLNR
jgi:NAD(P)-dependent dehydrogenase (short-subunit alcohol dehydrogenase family)